MSNSSCSRPVHPVVAALDAVDDTLTSGTDAPLWTLDDTELETALERAEQVAAKHARLRMRLVAEADGRDLGRRLGASSTAAWLRHRYRLRPGHARGLVETANGITASVDGPTDYAANVGSAVSGREMPATGEALADGRVSEAHAVVIGRAMGRLPGQVDAVVGAEIERQLASLATQFDPGELGNVADTIIDALAEDTLADDEDEAIARRELRLSEHTGRVSGRLDPEAMAMVRAMLDPLAEPLPTSEDGDKDERTYPKRLADALVEITRRVLGHTDWLPTQHGVRPHLNVVTELNPDQTHHDDSDGPDAHRRDTDNSATTATDSTSTADTASTADTTGNTGRAANGANGANGEQAAGGDRADSRSPNATTGQAGGAAAHGPRLGGGEPTWGRPLSAATVGRLACDAGVTWIITDPAGVPLNVGRERRTVTPAQWAALIVRDGGCRFPGCTRAVEWCEAHHIIWWRFGGTTDLANLVLLCAHHHRTIHHHGWNITLAPDGIPEFVPPPWVDPEQTPRRSVRPRYYRNNSP